MRRRLAASILVAVVLAVLSSGCVGRKAGNDSEKQPGEQNPARNGPPYSRSIFVDGVVHHVPSPARFRGSPGFGAGQVSAARQL